MNPPIVSLTNVTAGYGDGPILRDVDFALSAGEVVAVLGANGSGKSTLIKTILNSTTVLAGAVELFGTPAADFRDWQRIGYVPQRIAAGGGIPATVREVVSSGRLARRRWFRPMSAADRRAIERAIEVVDLADRSRAPIGTLSGGQQRRALIARALAGEPDVLVMDEPMAGVDAASQQLLSETLATLVGLGTTILLVAHELGPIEPLVTRVVNMRDGAVACDGPVAEHATHGAHDDHDPHPHGETARAAGLGLIG
jgi:zinc transport system ATP-binding protein